MLIPLLFIIVLEALSFYLESSELAVLEVLDSCYLGGGSETATITRVRAVWGKNLGRYCLSYLARPCFLQHGEEAITHVSGVQCCMMATEEDRSVSAKEK